jgi:hypothetical protein
MKLRLLILPLLLAMSLPYVAQAATETATCKDGTTYSGPSRSGACKGHQGVQSWGAATPAAPTAAGTTAAATSSTTTTTKGSAQASPSSTAQPATPNKSGTPAPGQVWVNTSSKVYHCAGTKYYGKTKAGKYMTEADAKAQGFHPVGGKSCST